jgi:nitrogen fixation protein FixH
MDIRDKSALYEIKHKLGGSIYTMANANALRYQLSHRKGLIVLIKGVNGLIRNPTRMLQMNKLCLKYGIELLYPKPLTFNNG